jgi:chromosome segregation ATPase
LEEDNEITLEETVAVQDRLIQKYERQIKSLDQKISSLEAENKKLTEKLEEYKTTVDDKDADNAIIVDRQENNINRMNVKINQLMKEVEMKDEKIQHLESEAKETSENSISKEKQIGSLEEKINYLSLDLNEKKEENLKIQEELKEAQAENIRISNEAARISGNLDGQKEKISTDEAKMNALQVEVFDLNELVKAKDSEIEELKALDANNISKIADLEKTVNSITEAGTQSQQTKSDMEDRYTALEAQYKALEDQVAQTEQSLANTIKDYEELEQKKTSFETMAKEQQELHVGTIKGRSKIINYIKEQLSKTVSKLSITTPNILDLKQIAEQLPTISKRIQVRIATHVNPEINQHIEILTQLKRNGDVSIRNYIKEDRWCIERDSAEILLAHGGVEPVGILLQDADFITLIRNFISEPWITSKIM